MAELSVSQVHGQEGEVVPVDRVHEIEAALIIYADTPQAIEQRLADLRTLAGFRLVPRATETIMDTYFDTADRSLQARLISLRVRRLDGVPLLTMKADSHPALVGQDRIEIEYSWSPGALHDVVSELRKRGVSVPASDKLYVADPREAMASLGLEKVQARVTRRTPRDVLARGPETRPVAELAIDAVTYHFHDKRIRLFEVEVEAKGDGDASTVKQITESLYVEFPVQLRLWPYGKLSTGKAIQELLADGKLHDLIGEDDVLRPAAYEHIAQLLA